MTKRIALIATTLLTATLFAASAAHAQEPPPDVVVSVAPDPVEVGADFTVTLELLADIGQCPGGDAVVTAAIIQPEPVVVLGPLEQVGPNGTYRATFSAPGAPGEYRIGGEWANTQCELLFRDDARLTVIAAPTTTTTTTTTTTIPEETTTTTVAPTTTEAAVVPPVPTAPPEGLPATGQTTDGLVWLAIASLMLGVGFVTVAARRS